MQPKDWNSTLFTCRADVLCEPAEEGVYGRAETDAANAKLLYVGITRARHTLVLSHTGQVTPLLPSDPNLYQANAI